MLVHPGAVYKIFVLYVAVAEHGADWLYSKEIAATLAAEIQAAGGIITKDDITQAKPSVQPALEAVLQEHRFLSIPPPSSAVTVAFALRFLQDYPSAEKDKESNMSIYRLVSVFDVQKY